MITSIFGCTRNSLIGDIIVSLPFLTYLEKKYPKSYKCSYIDKKCSQIIPFLINHPLIDKIQISNKSDEVTNIDIDFINKFDIKYHPFPQHPYEHDYWNHRHFVHETFLMNFKIHEGYIDPMEWNSLTKEETFPKLSQWFDISKNDKSIAIWPFSGYTRDSSISSNLRSPSKEWWNSLCLMLPDYKILQFGHPDSESLEGKNIIDCRRYSLFDAIKASLGCDCSITTDSGPSWILGAYGANQICLYTNYAINHHSNLDCYVPLNHKGNLIPIFGKNGINNILPEHVISNIMKFI